MEKQILLSTYNIKIRKDNKWTSTLVFLGLALFIRIALFFVSGNSNIVETGYSSSFYPYISMFLGYISNIIPFSIAEFLLLAICLIIITLFFAIFANRSFFVKNIVAILHFILRLFALIYILFYLLWGFNYYREDYLALANIDEYLANHDELMDLTFNIIDKANLTREVLHEDANGVFILDDKFEDLSRIANVGFNNYIVGNLDLGRNFIRVKPVFLSKYMSYTGITGIFIPFTSEANVNVDIPHQSLLSTITHEIAHQKGFAKEEEANFIAYKANINNPDQRFQYSGYYLAMQHLMNEVYRESREDYFLLYSKLSDAVKRDIEHSRDYWATKEGNIRKTATKLNDTYLKVNNQTNGVKSYRGVVRLLLAEYNDQKD